MTNPNDDLERSIQAYVADEMSPQELADFEEILANDTELAIQVDAQRAIEQRLRQVFSVAEKSVTEIESWLPDADSVNAPDAKVVITSQLKSNGTIRRHRRSAIAVMIIATSALVLLLFQWGKNSSIQPYFQRQSLAQLYRETVRHGFEPYYYCEDEERFAKTFLDRQRVALRLKPNPESEMIGLSYPGGLSRLTTAMLCLVQGEPVIVFIDQLDTDDRSLAESEPQDLFVHRAELGGLVLYEVSPFDAPKMMSSLEVLR